MTAHIWLTCDVTYRENGREIASCRGQLPTPFSDVEKAYSFATEHGWTVGSRSGDRCDRHNHPRRTR